MWRGERRREKCSSMLTGSGGERCPCLPRVMGSPFFFSAVLSSLRYLVGISSQILPTGQPDPVTPILFGIDMDLSGEVAHGVTAASERAGIGIRSMDNPPIMQGALPRL